MKLPGLFRKKSKSLSESHSFGSGSSKSPAHTPKSVLDCTPSSSSPLKVTSCKSEIEICGDEEESGRCYAWAMGVEELREVFKVFDIDGDGKISGVELGRVLRRLGYGQDALSDEEVHLMVSAADKDGDGSIDLEEFISLNNIPSTTADDLKDAFHVFDADQNGLISAEELHAVLTSLGDDGCTLHDCRRMIHGVDADGDGFVDFPEFLRMMMTK